MTKLSVNINKVATLRNARGGDVPNVIKVAINCQRFGAQGITVHPRPDERHIRYQDVRDLRPIVSTEFNMEGYPEEKFINLVLENKPEQVTLVPDPPNVLTSNAGWDLTKTSDFLKPIIAKFKSTGIRVSIFLDPDVEQVKLAPETGTDRIELYTEQYASHYKEDKEKAVEPYVKAAIEAQKLGIELNAGHDLSLENLAFLKEKIPFLAEVSIGHALIADALYLGLENTIQLYLNKLR